MKTAILSLALLLLASCQDNKKEQLLYLVQEWQGKEIRFPRNPVFTRFVTDTTDYRLPVTADYKVVVYVDSIGCVSCKLQLREWKKFIAQVDSATDGNVPFLFFFQSKDNDELRYILRRDNFTLPVCVDTDNHFYNLNHFPDEMTFQTFLVDRDNHVKVIGNPIHNLSVRDLYLKELTGAAASSLPATHLQIDTLEYDLGTVPANGTKVQTVCLRNTGPETFRLKGITTSCDCTTAQYNWQEIHPGETKRITVSYRAEQSGDFLRTVTIYGNIPEKNITLTFVGKVAGS